MKFKKKLTTFFWKPVSKQCLYCFYRCSMEINKI